MRLPMRDVLLDIRYAARSLRRTPGFTIAAAITLALGIGANSAIFTLLDAVMFKPLGLPDADALVVLYTLAAQVTGDTQTMALAIQKALEAAEPGLVIETTGTMATYVTQATSRERLVTYLVSTLGALSLLLACVGLYGVLSYTVVRRLPELGVRAALGATPAGLRNLVLRDAVQMIVGGTLVGLGVAWWANRLIQSQLFDVGVFDPLSCAIVIAVLAASALAACLIPAARAARIDPLHALRQE